MLRRVYAYLAIEDVHLPYLDRLRAGRAGRTPAGYVEPSLMIGTFDFILEYVPLGQIARTVGALVLAHVENTVEVVHGICRAPCLGALRAARGNLRGVAQSYKSAVAHVSKKTVSFPPCNTMSHRKTLASAASRLAISVSARLPHEASTRSEAFALSPSK